MADKQIRLMTNDEQLAYLKGSGDAQTDKPMDAKARDLHSQRLTEAYERGYRNWIGEAVDG